MFSSAHGIMIMEKTTADEIIMVLRENFSAHSKERDIFFCSYLN
jgi:hypothetical protein